MLNLDCKLSRLKANFNSRNIEVLFFDSLKEVKNEIVASLPLGASIGIGHSLTLQKMKLSQILKSKGFIIYDKELGKNLEECYELKKKALTSDWYISGSNAVSMDGSIVNMDHSGNRVAALTFGPTKVIIVVGRSKIVDTLEEGINRVKNIACPLNAKRAGFNPPCVSLGKCVECNSSQRVCNTLSIIQGQANKNRMKLFIVNEDLGY